ncbi:MFS transporter [Picrophilus oshimae]|uniref:Predicted arabinose efflux permease, MFS family n=1 Tax=Picrophilus torridus (strain ATCC 700027 / DSM 9790 / JCM 10055 / NBRC 100828 / KAW 2/3) TaxID=1122961 RepID=A0A8G2FXY8_PICTO|nr:MFS transporter [Picrophilus oshimae]SMD31451.1 Predicted arabinose efflux permease, MFS family [Picrophilus oshimae DSM 9789]
MAQEADGINSDLPGHFMGNADEVRRRSPWTVLIALAMGMLVYGVAESYGPVSVIGGILPAKYFFIGLSLPYIAGGVGALFSGSLADKIGRRGSFMVTSAMIIIGIAIFAFLSRYVIALVISFILVGMAAIGLETPTLSMIVESVPASVRGRSLVIVQNFGNIGVAVTFIPVLLHFSGATSRLAISMLFIAPLIALGLSWFYVKESKPWRAVKSTTDIENAWQEQDGNAEPVKPEVGIPLRFLILIIIGIAQDVAFLYFSYGVGYSYFSSGLADNIPIIGGFTMTIVGIITGLVLVEKLNRKSFTIMSYGLLVVLWAVLWIFEALTHSTYGLILTALMVLLFIPGEVTWAARGMLEPELFPTYKRGTYVSIVRFTVWVGAGLVMILLTYRALPFIIPAASVMSIFILSLIMTILWQRKGFETRSRSLSGLDRKISHDIKR